MILMMRLARRGNPLRVLAGAVIASTALSTMFAAPARASPERWRAEGWAKTDFSKRSIEWREIMSGGPPKDGIPSIDAPMFQPVANEQKLGKAEAVIGLEINGDARAYPIRILMWHEIVNDVVGGVPVTVTYCPLCNAAIVFDRRTPVGTLIFGTTGKLRNSDLVMYDRQTESWWQQFSGTAIVGKLTGQTLRLVPARLEAFSLFKKRFPKGRVLIPNDPSYRAYGRNPYEGYDSSAVPFLYRGELPKDINPMTRVVVVRKGTTASAVTMELLRKHQRLHISDVTLSWRKGQASALDHVTVAGGRDVGNVVAQKADDKGELRDIPYDVTFAFVFHAFHPEANIFQKCGDSNGVQCSLTPPK